MEKLPKISGYLQSGWNYTSNETGSSSSFQAKRLRLLMDGKVGEKVDFRLQIEAFNGIAGSTNGNGSQELHYLGIPLNVIYRFARIKRLSFYASAGGQVDFYLAGRQKDEGYDEGISGSGYKELKHENVQFSVQANVGAALTLYKQTELYLEPYMAYYFENNSSIHNIWKDKPFNFGLTLGVRTGF